MDLVFSVIHEVVQLRSTEWVRGFRGSRPIGGGSITKDAPPTIDLLIARHEVFKDECQQETNKSFDGQSDGVRMKVWDQLEEIEGRDASKYDLSVTPIQVMQHLRW